ncbi:hypothetical protein wNi1_07440 [Wolbachia pipientis]|nr:hypothetical protein wHmt_08010 [Wolbachia pipientis]
MTPYGYSDNGYNPLPIERFQIQSIKQYANQTKKPFNWRITYHRYLLEINTCKWRSNGIY